MPMSRQFILGGRELVVGGAEEVVALMKGLRPKPIRRYFVDIDGARFPVKQVLERLMEAKEVGLYAADVTSRDANRVLRTLGFQVKAA